MKKGQVTLLIIVSIVVVLAIGLFFVLREGKVDLINQVDPEVRPIYSYVDNCLEATLIDGAYYVGENSGYFETPEKSTEEGFAYYYDRGSFFPERRIVENELSKYVESLIGFCTGEYSGFEEFEISEGNIEVQTTILDEEIISKTNFKVDITKEDSSYSFESFERSIPIRLGLVHNVSGRIVSDLVRNDGNACVSCIDEYGEMYDMNISVFNNEEADGFIFVVRDAKSNLNGIGEYRYIFASK